jgi:hypothetical protein
MPNEQTMKSVLEQALSEADAAFVHGCAERMEKGEEKYGPFKFFEVDTVEEAMLEALDLANYARFIYIKLFLLQRATKRFVAQDPRTDAQGFIPLKEMLGR